MILCCTTCGNSFLSDTQNVKCPYCANDTEILITNDELISINKEEILEVSETLKEKYKSGDNINYNEELWKIREEKDTANILNQQIKEFKESVINHKTTTGYNFDGYIITKYNDVISGNVVLGTGIFSEWSASIDDLLGTTSTPFENKMEKAKSIAVKKLIRKSVSYGGNAIIGIDFDFFTIGNNMIAVSANGTSVVIEKKIL